MSTGSTRASRWLAPSIAALTALLALPGLFTLSRVFFVRDLTTTFLPHHLWFRRTLLEGHAPFWNPHPGLGYATVADPTFHTLFPLTLPLRLLPAIAGFNLIVALPFPLAAAGMALFLRRHASQAAACLGAIVVAASGPFLSTANTPNLAWSIALAPWVLLALDVFLESRSPRRFAALSLALGLMFLAGEPVTFAATAAVALVYAARSGVAASLATLGAAVVGVLLGAVQLFPLLDAHRRSIRATGALIDTWSLHPGRLIELVVPFFFGKWVGMPDEITRWLLAVNDRREPFLVSVYVGTGALVLALLGAARARRSGFALFWSLVALVSLVFAFGSHTPIYPLLQRVVPFVAGFRFPSKHLLLTTLALGVLAALGFDALGQGTRRRLLVPLALAALAVTGLLLAFAAPSAGLVLAGGLARTLDLSDPALAAASLLGRVRVAMPHLLAVSSIAGIGLWLARTPERARTGRALVFALVAADLVLTNAAVNPTLEATALAPFSWVGSTARRPADRVFVSSNLGEGLNPIEDAAPVPDYPLDTPPTVHQALYDMLLCSYGSCPEISTTLTRDLTGLRPREYLTLLREFSESERALRYRFLSHADTRYYLLAAAPPFPALELERLPRLGGMTLYESEPAGGRAVLRSRAEVTPDPDAQIRRLFAADFDPATTVSVDRIPDEPSGDTEAVASASVAIVESAPTSVVVEVSAPEDAYLVLRDAYDPGWRVEVDGAAASLLRADGIFRAVRLRAGNHSVRFSFRPRSLVIGGWISLAAAVGIAALFLQAASARSTR